MPMADKMNWVLKMCRNPRRAFDRLKHHFRKKIAVHTRNGYYSLCAPLEFGGFLKCVDKTFILRRHNSSWPDSP